MMYAIVPMEDITPRLITKAGCTSIQDLRTNILGTKVVVKISDSNKYHFEKYTKYTSDEISTELGKSEWTGQSWYSTLLG